MKKAFKLVLLPILLCLACLCLFACSKTKYYEYTGATMSVHEGTAKSLKVEAAEGEKFILISPAITVRTERDGSATKFVGWQIKGQDEVYPAGEQLTMTKKNMTLIAVWKDAYTLTFTNTDSGATGNLPEMEEDYFAVGEQVTLPECDMTKQGYTFGGWKDANGKIYQAKSTFVMPNAHTQLTTTWTNVYSLTFLAGAGENQQVEGDAPTIAPRELNSSVYLPKCTFTSAGYDFVCWQDQDGTNYNAGDLYVVKGNVTFIAIWQKSTTASDENFDFALLADGTYSIAKTNTATLTGNLVLPAVFNDKAVTVIAENAFKGTAIESVTIPESVTAIKANAFYGCTKLSTVIFDGESQLKTIEQSAFASSVKLSTFGATSTAASVFVLPESVTTIQNNAFFGCNLKAVTLSDNLTTLGTGVFANNQNLTAFSADSQYFKGGSFLTNADQTVIYAFAYACQGADSVNIDTATEIADYAFAYANKITSLTLGSQVQKIGKQAFANCYTLTEITQNNENSLNTVSDGAFLACSGIKTFYIGKNLTSLALSAFEGCIGISFYKVHSDNPSYGTYGDNLYTKDKTVFLLYAPSNENPICTLHAYTAVIAEGAFQYGNVEQVIKQGDDSVTITVGDKAFYHCPQLRVIDFWDKITTIGNRAFEYCTMLDNAVLGNSLTSLGEYAFYYCEKLSSVNISADCSLKTISQFAFANSGLTSFNAKSKIEAIQQNAFAACPYLSTLFLEGVKTIAFSAFASCEKLTSVEIPLSLVSIEGGAFKSCNALSFSVAENVTAFSADDKGNLYNSDKTELLFCAQKNAMAAFVLPDSVKTIAPYTFYEYTLTSFDAKNSALETIGEYAFANCASLEKAFVPATLKTIKQSAFEKCTLLTDFAFVDANSNKVSQNLEKIEKNAFKNCVRLNIYLLGDNIPIIDEEAFYLEPEAQNTSFKPEIFVDATMIEEFKTRCTSIASFLKAYSI